MDEQNKIIQLNPPVPVGPVDKIKDQMKEIVDYIIDNAPPEALIDFSKQFLTESFMKSPDRFQESYEQYRASRNISEPEYGQLLNFSNFVGGNNDSKS